MSRHWNPETPRPQNTLLCHIDEVKEGDAKGVGPVGGLKRKIILIKRNGVLHAWLDACPHYSTGTPMSWKADAYFNGDKSHLACHSHGALFDIETGECVLGPCLGQRLTPVEFTVSDGGEIFIASPAEEERP